MSIPASSFNLQAEAPKGPKEFSVRIRRPWSDRDYTADALSQAMIPEALDYPQ